MCLNAPTKSLLCKVALKFNLEFLFGASLTISKFGVNNKLARFKHWEQKVTKQEVNNLFVIFRSKTTYLFHVPKRKSASMGSY